MPKWTDAQQDAIDARGGNILVSAAAGSGKTAVLIERVSKCITDPGHPVDIDRLLIVTFMRLRQKCVLVFPCDCAKFWRLIPGMPTLSASCPCSAVRIFAP